MQSMSHILSFKVICIVQLTSYADVPFLQGNAVSICVAGSYLCELDGSTLDIIAYLNIISNCHHDTPASVYRI